MKWARAWACLLLYVSSRAVSAGDPGDLSVAPPSRLDLDGGGTEVLACPPVSAIRLTLNDVLRRGLCWSPKTRGAWADVEQKAAELGLSRAAYEPSLSASFARSRSHRVIEDAFAPMEESNQVQYEINPGAQLNWTLWDFGSRRAHVHSAEEMLIAARAAHDQQIQDTLSELAHDYFAAVEDQAVLAADQESESVARGSLSIVDGRFHGGNASLSEIFQTRTALAHATAKRIASDGELHTARGALTLALGLSPDLAPTLEDDAEHIPEAAQPGPVAALLRRALASSPKVIAARADLDAARYDIDSAAAANLPVATLQGLLSTRRDQYTSGSSFSASDIIGNSSMRNSRVSINISVPIFDGSYHGKLLEARAKGRSRASELETAERTVTLAVWNNYGEMQTAAATAAAAGELIAAATLSLEAAQQLYKQGVGPLADVLTAQTNLASARQEKIHAVSKWRTSRWALAASVGSLTATSVDADGSLNAVEK